MTPSTTAWPPTKGLVAMNRRLANMLFFGLIFTTESIDATLGVQQLGFTGKMRVTSRADIDVILSSGSGFILRSTSANDGDSFVFRMNVWFHKFEYPSRFAANAKRGPAWLFPSWEHDLIRVPSWLPQSPLGHKVLSTPESAPN